MPAWVWWFILGALVAWLVEWVIDWQFWRARLRKTLAVHDSSSALRERMLADPAFSRRGSQPAAARQSQIGDEVEQWRAALADAQQLAQRREVEAADARDALASARAEIARRRAQSAPAASVEQDERADSERAQLQARVAELEQQLASTPATRDALTAINGIGAAFEKRLYEAGIYTYAQLAQQNPQHLRKVVRANDRQPLKPEAWIAQARALAQQHADEWGTS